MAQVGLEGFDSGMLGFEDVLSDDDIWAVLAFIKSSWPDDLREAQARMTLGERMADEVGVGDP